MEEKKYFEYVKNYINDKLKEEVESFDDLEFRFRRDPERYYVPYTLACQTIKVLEKSKEKPYFARIDFKEEGKENINSERQHILSKKSGLRRQTALD